MRKLRSFIVLAGLLALPAFGAAPALAVNSCPPGTTNPSYCPAPTVVTGGSAGITTTGATVAGTINPNGTTAFYTFQYGTSTAYGLHTAVGTVAATSSPTIVAAAITGLTPGTLYHYRLIAVNNGGVVGAGVDRTFTTLATPPAAKLKTSLTLKAKPKRDKALPFKYAFSGTVKVPKGTSKAAVCSGKVTLKLTKGKKTVAKGTATVSKKCTYKKTIKIKRTTKTGTKKGKLKVAGRYGGNSKLKISKKTITVRFF